MKIGLIGEAPHDTNCIAVLLGQKYPGIEFFPLIDRIRGSQLDCRQPTKQLLRIEYQFRKPDLVIFIRDLDGLKDEIEKINLRKEYFTEYRRVVDGKAIMLLNIYELEALILADVEKFGLLFDCATSSYPDPSAVVDPKGELKKLSHKYSEGQNLEVFKVLDINIVSANCLYFKEFLDKLKPLIA